MKRYAMYLRKSRADQDETITETLRRHKETLLEYAVKNDLSIAQQDIYEEVVSGESLYARPRMLKLLEQVSNGMYTGVLCMDIDRLGRGGMSDQGIILESFKQSNTQILTPSKVYDLNDENDENNLEFKAFFARFEYKQIKKRMQAGTRKSVQEGCYLACAPFGYENVKVNKKCTLKINEYEAKYVRLMFEMYTNQHLGCQTIADRLNAMGVKPHRNDKWGRTSVMSILKNPTFNGKIVWDKVTYIRKGTDGSSKHARIYNPPEKWTIVDGIHPAIIDDELWKKTQDIIKNRTHPPSFTGELKNALSGLVFCANCGNLMTRTAERYRSGKIEKPRYLCLSKSCIPGVKYELLEKAVLNAIRTKISELSVENQQQFNVAEKEKFSDQLEKIESNIKIVNKQKAKLHELLEREIYDIDTFLERQQVLQSELEALTQQYQNIKEQADSVKMINIKQMQQNIDNVLSAYQNADIPTRNELLKSIISKITYYKDKKTKPADFNLEIELKQVYY